MANINLSNIAVTPTGTPRQWTVTLTVEVDGVSTNYTITAPDDIETWVGQGLVSPAMLTQALELLCLNALRAKDNF